MAEVRSYEDSFEHVTTEEVNRVQYGEFSHLNVIFMPLSDINDQQRKYSIDRENDKCNLEKRDDTVSLEWYKALQEMINSAILNNFQSLLKVLEKLFGVRSLRCSEL